MMKYTKLKPVFDYGLIILVLVPVVGLVILIIVGYLLQTKGLIFFYQKRIGLNNKIFTMYKFRSLHPDETRPLKDRKFGWGSFLRNTNLDELPQVLNVLRGEMSLVGPRPLPVEYANLFSMEQNKRHQVLPGITGLAQVSGKNDLSWDEKFKLDLEYVNKVSFVLDSKILVKTLILALSFKKDTSLAEKKFTG